jgi:hypothetical protein
MDLRFNPVPPKAKPQDTIPDKVGYSCRTAKWFLTLSIILHKQQDNGLLKLACDLQKRLRSHFAGWPLLESPASGTGLYFYPVETLHCSLINYCTADSPEEIDAALNRYVTAIEGLHGLATFSAQAKWLFAFPSGINLARWISDEKRELQADQRNVATEAFRQLDKGFGRENEGPFTIDRLSFVKSDSWLSNQNPEQKSLFLVE